MADEPETQEVEIPVEPKRSSSSRIIYYSIIFTVLIVIVAGYLIVNTATTRMNPNCGPGLSCMNQSAVISLFGQGGTYKSYLTTDSKTIQNLTNESSITEAWVVAYSNTNAKSNFLEGVFKSPDSRALYIKILFQNPNHVYYNITNATADGMIYSAVTYQYNDTIIVSLVGYKNSEVTEIIYSGSSAPSLTNLVSVAASDMP